MGFRPADGVQKGLQHRNSHAFEVLRLLPKRLVQYAVASVTPRSTVSGLRGDSSRRKLAEPWEDVQVNRDGGPDVLAGLLAGAHLAVPDDLPTLLSEHGSLWGPETRSGGLTWGFALSG
jgi:hypothetical protein